MQKLSYKGKEMTNFESVKKFMETFGQEIREKASFPNEKIVSLRCDLIKEELDELQEAIKNKDITSHYCSIMTLVLEKKSM